MQTKIMEKKHVKQRLHKSLMLKKFLTIMKLTTLFILVALMQVSAIGFSQSSKLSVNFENQSLEEVFSYIEQHTDYSIFYKNELIEKTKLKSGNYADTEVFHVLNDVLEGENLSYQIKGKIILIVPGDNIQNSDQQHETITGRVTDSSGSPLPGVTVVVKGTTNGTVTNIDGEYTISNIPNDAILQFSFVGMKAQEIPVSGKSTIDVVLAEDAIGLEEVVAIGYGTQSRKDVTGSISSVYSGDIQERASASVSQSLQGRIAGVEMTQTNSRPGSDMQIRIRGTRSLTASNDPLIVLDGIPFAGSLSDINPNDIKSVDVLKDASATAVYGSRGANGVIIISTFKAESVTSGKPVVSYSGYYGVKSIMNEFPMMNAQEYIAYRDMALENGSPYQYGDDEDKSLAINWQDKVFKTGIVNSQNIRVSAITEGGGGFSFGIGYLDETSVMPGQEFERYSFSGSFDQELGKFIKVGINTIGSLGIIDGGVDNALGTVLSLTPITNPYKENGDINPGPLSINSLDVYYNPLLIDKLGDQWQDRRKTMALYNNLYAEVKLLQGLRYRMNVGANYRQSNYGEFAAAENVFNPNMVSKAEIENSLTTNWTFENLLYYDRAFGKHKINLVGMLSAERTENNVSNIQAQDVTADYLQYYNLGLLKDDGEITIDPEKQNYFKRSLQSGMFRASYSYENKYMLTATVRSDGSSVLAEGRKWHTYPAASIGWNIANEDFMKDISFIDYLKLRTGYGQTSNQAIAPYQTFGQLSTNYYNFGEKNVTGYYVSNLPNGKLGWEFSTTWNYGLDFGVLNNRLTGTIEYYTQKTKDVLVAQSLPVTSGVKGSYMVNMGQTANKGFELSLNASIIQKDNGLNWDLGLNLYANRNKIVSLASGQKYDKANGWFVDEPINVIYDYRKIGIWQLGEEDEVKKYEGSSAEIGTIKVEYTGDYDANGDPTRLIGEGTTLEDDDRQILGSVDPKFQGGFNTSLRYKGFELSAIGTFKSGGLLVSSLYGTTSYLNMADGRRGQIKVDYWTPDNPTNAYPKPYGPTTLGGAKHGSTLAYFDASYMKITNITLAYNFKNKSWMERYGVKKLRVYLSAQNPFIFASPYYSHSGMDPEPNSNGNENQLTPENSVVPERIAVVGYNTPSSRNYLFGVNLTF